MQHYRVHCGLLSFCICNSSLWSEKRCSCYLFRNSCDQFPHVWPVFQMHTIPTKCPTPSTGRPLPSHLPWSLTPRPLGLRRFALAQPSTPCSWPLGSLPSTPPPRAPLMPPLLRWPSGSEKGASYWVFALVISHLTEYLMGCSPGGSALLIWF